MTAMDAKALPGENTRNGSQTTFVAQVERHAGLVYSAARRQLQDCRQQVAQVGAQQRWVAVNRNKEGRHAL